MLVRDLFESLSYGDLSSLSLSGNAAGSVRAADQAKLISHINKAVRHIHSRAPHILGFATVELKTGIQLYRLRQEYAVNDTTPGNTNVRYVVDTPEDPFTDKVLRILRARHRKNAPAGTLPEQVGSSVPEGFCSPHHAYLGLSDHELGLNAIDSDCEIRIASNDTIRVEEPVDGMQIEIEYTAHPTVLTLPVDLEQEIPIDPVLEEALEMRVAGRILRAMGSADHRSRGQELLQDFEAAMAVVRAEDLMYQTRASEHGKLMQRGFA